MSLTVAIMALRDLKNNNLNSAMARLKIDADKIIITNRELYDLIMKYPK